MERSGALWELCEAQDVAVGILEPGDFGAARGGPDALGILRRQAIVSKCTPLRLRAETVSAISGTCQPRMVNGCGLKEGGTLVTRSMMPWASRARAKLSWLTTGSPSMPS